MSRVTKRRKRAAMIEASHLQPGDYLTPGQLEEYLDLEQDAPRWSLHLMALKNALMAQLERDGRHLVLKAERGGLRVLTQSEAMVYTDEQVQRGREHLERWFRREQCVDVAALTDADQAEHAANLAANGRLVEALRQAAPVVIEQEARPSTPARVVKGGARGGRGRGEVRREINVRQVEAGE